MSDNESLKTVYFSATQFRFFDGGDVITHDIDSITHGISFGTTVAIQGHKPEARVSYWALFINGPLYALHREE